MKRTLPNPAVLFPLLIAAGGLSHFSGCAVSPDHAVKSSDAATRGSAIAGLQRRASIERDKPERLAAESPDPPGLDPAVLDAGPLSEDALRPFTAELQARFPLKAVERPRAATPVDAASRAEALSHYAAGREKMLAGDAAGALTEFQRATKLDPDAAEPCRDLAEAQLALSRRSGARMWFEEAIVRGIADARPYAWLGREALRLKSAEPAAALLFEARGRDPGASDPGLPFVVDADLAECLESLGLFRAARDLYQLALNLPEQFNAPTFLRAELSELYRRRGELWMHAGDLSCRLGDFDAADAAYARSLSFPNPDPGAVAVRRIHASLRQGRPAAAALILAEDVRAAQGRVDDRQISLVSYLAANTKIGPALAETIREIARELEEPVAPTIRFRLARVDAAALPADKAREVLRAALMQRPTDAETVLALLDLSGFEGDDAAARELARLAKPHPDRSGFLAETLLLRGKDVESTVRFFGGGASKSRPEEHRLLRAELLRRTGRPREAVAELTTMPANEWSDRAKPHAMASLAECAAAAANWDDATRAADLIAESPSLVARARSLIALQKITEAAEALRPLVAQSSQTAIIGASKATADGSAVAETGTDDLTFVAEAAFSAGNHDLAEQAARLAATRDRFDDRPAAVLFNLYGPGGPLKDDVKFADAVRTLRQASPSSRLIRAIVARDLIGRSLHAQAEPYLLALAENSPFTGDVSDMLCRVWEHASTADAPRALRGEAWLAARIAATPESVPLIAAHARILAATGRAREAESLLEGRLAVWPLPNLARLRERIVRERLGETERAETLVRDRLTASPPTVENSIELAELLARKGDALGAATALVKGLPPSIALSKEQEAFLVGVLTRLSANPDDASAEEAAGAVALFDRASEQRIALSRDLAFKRLRLLARAFPDQTERLYDATKEAISRFPETGLAAYDQLHQSLIKAAKPDAEIRFLRMSLDRSEPWNADIARVAVVRVATVGTPDDAKSLFESVRGPERLRALLRALRADDELQTEDAMRAEFAYTFGVLLYNFDRQEDALDLYRIAISLSPDHALANNNLGYHYAERGENLDEAEKLLEHAYLSDPNNYSITDSLGWLRYKRNILADETNANGQVVREGAATLVKRALENSRGSESEAALLDHMGDILWRQGQKEQAVGMWQQSHGLILSRVLAARKNSLELTPAGKRDSKEFDRIHQKAIAARNGREPAVSPIHGEPIEPREAREPEKK